LIDALVWNAGDSYASLLKTTNCMDIAAKLEINRWKSRENVQLNVVDMRASL
jgi:hypothetical protein